MKSIEKVSRTAFVWTIAILIMILVLATAGILAAFIIGTGDETPNIIALSPGEYNEDDSNSLFYVMYQRVPKKSDVEFGEGDGTEGAVWSAETSIDLFKDCYVNDKGEITVKSADGRPVVAPGTSGDYEFSLKNTGNTILNSTISLSGTSALFGDSIPFKIRLARNGDWVIGSDAEWCDAKELDNYSDNLSVRVGESVLFRLEWMWAYESEFDKIIADKTDTEIGAASSDPGNVFSLTIDTLSEEIPGAVAVDENGNPIYIQVFSPVASVWVVILSVLAIISAILLLLVLIFGLGRISVSGVIFGADEGIIRCGDCKSNVESNGVYALPFMRIGKCRFKVLDSDGGLVAEYVCTIKRSSEVEDVTCTFDTNGRLNIIVNKKAIKLRMDMELSDGMLICDPLSVEITEYRNFRKAEE